MDFLSPAKLLVILVVALVVLGPDKLPKVAKQIGSLWGDFRKFRERLESDVRNNFPDLPSTETITHAVRSPLSFLDTLADTHSAENGATSTAANGFEPPEAQGDDVQPVGRCQPAGGNRAGGGGDAGHSRADDQRRRWHRPPGSFFGGHRPRPTRTELTGSVVRAPVGSG